MLWSMINKQRSRSSQRAMRIGKPGWGTKKSSSSLPRNPNSKRISSRWQKDTDVRWSFSDARLHKPRSSSIVGAINVPRDISYESEISSTIGYSWWTQTAADYGPPRRSRYATRSRLFRTEIPATGNSMLLIINALSARFAPLTSCFLLEHASQIDNHVFLLLLFLVSV